MSTTGIEIIDFLIATKNKKGLFDLLSTITENLLNLLHDEDMENDQNLRPTMIYSQIGLVNSILNDIVDDGSLDFRLNLLSFIDNTFCSLRERYLSEKDTSVKEEIKESIWQLIDGLSPDTNSIMVSLTEYDDGDYLTFFTNSNIVRFSTKDFQVEKSFEDFSDAFDSFHLLLLESDVRESEIIKQWQKEDESKTPEEEIPK